MTHGSLQPSSYSSSDIGRIRQVPANWRLLRNKYIVKELDERSTTGEEVLLSLTKDRGLIPHNLASQREASARTLVGYKLCSPGQIVMNRMQAWNGMFAIADMKGLVSPDYTVLQPLDEANAKYLTYLYGTPKMVSEFLSRSRGIGTGFLRLYWEDFGDIYCPIPPLEEQTSIATFLDEKTAEIDAAIAKKQRLIELLQEQKAILINRAVTKGLDPGIPLRDSGVEWIGEIPSHWEIISSKWMFAHRKERSRLSDQQLTASQEFGVIPQQEYMEKTGYRVMQVTLNTEILKHVEVDDFVISMRSFQGGLERAKANGCISSAYVVLESSPQANIDYFAYLFKSVRYIEALQSTSNLVRDGQALRYDNFCMVPLPVIPIKEQEAIAAFLDQATSQMDTLRENIQKEIELLKEFRTILISQAVTGKIKV